MNYFAYLTSGLAVKALSKLSRARMIIYGEKNIPTGPIIFAINHFTRIETLLMPTYIYRMTGVPVWSLADYSLFRGSLGAYLDKVGAVSTRDPDRDMIIVKSLLTAEANWIIFPEGRMVKSKKIFEKGRFMVSSPRGRHPPHTGVASLAIRTEFYRQRLLGMSEKCPDEVRRLLDLFNVDSVESVSEKTTYIVPVNLTYYPLRARENIINKLAASLIEDIPERITEEIMTEGAMLLSGVDIDIRFGRPIRISDFMDNPSIKQDISATCEINFDDNIPSIQTMREVAHDIMETYMSSIYSMTTVNHDHLFASFLKLMPFEKIDPNDLRRRVFLAANQNLAKTGTCLHTSLRADQVHLLTDDRYNKFREFMAVALEKGVIKEENGELVKDASKFSPDSDFHRVRLDNPISVMANEVEPLTLLQRRIRRLAWRSPSRIRRMTVNCLLKKAVLKFEEDYETFYIEGESKEKEVGMPVLLEGASEHIGVVLIHGYMAAPPEVRELADYLANRGLWVYCLRLKGHGTSPDDLAARTWNDWRESADVGYGIISNICKEVVVGGFSTGAALALDLAARVGDVKGVFAISPPFRLRDIAAKFVPAVDKWNRLMGAVHLNSARKVFVENRPENPHINYSRNPISGIKEIEKLMNDLEPRLSTIKVPALVAQSFKDPVVHYKGSSRIFELLGSEDKQYLLFNLERHGILLGEGSRRVHEEIWSFIKYI
ncbi:alpha/beta fold hydrolase [Desulfobacterales bacterium HSG2]|nr:alpha/beta fold hydrolase [Desulfobacterales bacterium HSG2]MDM8548549.1 alpha/beta fold hydrolase [Desulfobacterales bacterium HSG2]